MEERESNKDQKFRDIFRQLNEEQVPANNQWNIPSAELWSNISEVIQKDESKRWGWLWSLAAILLLFAFGGAILFLNGKNNNENYSLPPIAQQTHIEDVESGNGTRTSRPATELATSTPLSEKNNSLSSALTQKDEISSTKVDHQVKVETILENPNISKNSNPSPSRSAPSISIQNSVFGNNTILDGNKNNTIKAGLVDSNPIKNKELVLDSSSLSSPIEAENINPFAPTKKIKRSNTLSFIPPLISLLKYDSNIEDLNINEFIQEEKIELRKATRTPNVLVGLYYAPSASFSSIKGDQPEIITEDRIAYNLGTFGLRTELLLTKNFALELGVQRTQLKERTDYDVNFPYLNTDEHTNARGNFDNEFAHSLPSPNGNVSTLMALTRLASHDVSNGENINVTWLMNQELNFVSIPLVLKYYTSQRPISFSIRTGIIKHYRINSKAQISEFESHHDAIQYRHSAAEADVALINKSTMSLILGAGVNFRTQTGFNFFLEPSFTKSIIPVFKGTFDNLPYAYQVNIGLSYQLLK